MDDLNQDTSTELLSKEDSGYLSLNTASFRSDSQVPLMSMPFSTAARDSGNWHQLPQRSAALPEISNHLPYQSHQSQMWRIGMPQLSSRNLQPERNLTSNSSRSTYDTLDSTLADTAYRSNNSRLGSPFRTPQSPVKLGLKGGRQQNEDPVSLQYDSNNLLTSRRDDEIQRNLLEKPSLPSSTHATRRTKLKLNYFRESDRLLTFQKWKNNDIQPAGVLARNGFIFVKEPDMVRCVFCGGYLHEWDEDDVPSEVHKRFYPKCEYVRHASGEISSIDITKSPYYEMHGLRDRNISCDGGQVSSDPARRHVENTTDSDSHCRELGSSSVSPNVAESADAGSLKPAHRTTTKLPQTPAASSMKPAFTMVDVAVRMTRRMGFPQSKIQEAVTILEHNRISIKTTTLLETLLTLHQKNRHTPTTAAAPSEPNPPEAATAHSLVNVNGSVLHAGSDPQRSQKRSGKDDIDGSEIEADGLSSDGDDLYSSESKHEWCMLQSSVLPSGVDVVKQGKPESGLPAKAVPGSDCGVTRSISPASSLGYETADSGRSGNHSSRPPSFTSVSYGDVQHESDRDKPMRQHSVTKSPAYEDSADACDSPLASSSDLNKIGASHDGPDHTVSDINVKLSENTSQESSVVDKQIQGAIVCANMKTSVDLSPTFPIFQIAGNVEDVTVVNRTKERQAAAGSEGHRDDCNALDDVQVGLCKLQAERKLSFPNDNSTTLAEKSKGLLELKHEEKRKRKKKKKKKKENSPDPTEMARIKEESEEFRNHMICKVCLEGRVDRAFLPCGHLSCCDACSQKLRDCPMCRTRIIALVKVKTS